MFPHACYPEGWRHWFALSTAAPNRAEVSVIPIKGFAAMMCEICGVLADEPAQLLLFAFLGAIFKQQLARSSYSF